MGAYADVEKAKASRNIRRGKGKMRNRRYVGRKGPLIVFGEEGGISKAFRNLPGVEVSSVDSLNLLQVRCHEQCCCPSCARTSLMQHRLGLAEATLFFVLRQDCRLST